MGVYNEIGIGRWNRFIQKLTDMKGGPPARQLASEIQFQHAFFHGSENRYLESWDQWGIVTISAAIVGQSSAVRFRNPANSNVIAVFESITFFHNAAAPAIINIQYGAAALDLNTVGNGVSMDTRQQRTNSTMIPSFATSAPGNLAGSVFTASLGTSLSAQAIVTEQQEINVLPGSAIQILCGTVNTALNISAMWRERFLEPAERQ